MLLSGYAYRSSCSFLVDEIMKITAKKYVLSAFAVCCVALMLSGCSKPESAQPKTAPTSAGALSSAPPEVQQRMQRLQEEKARQATQK
jgi:uncharacterized lipoprotein YajG